MKRASEIDPFLSNDPRFVSPVQAFVDLTIFLAVMYLVRQFYISEMGFWGNTLFKSFMTVGAATLLLHLRGQNWRDLGLIKPKRYLQLLGMVVVTLAGVIATIMLFEIFIRDLLPAAFQTPSIESDGGERFDELKGNLPYFFSIILWVWIESCLEELQDRGFALNRFQSLFSRLPLAVVLAVVFQAAIFGYRHAPSHGLSGALTTGLIGLAFGISYVVFKRNLWPVIIAHVVLNTMSMVGRV